MKRIDARMEAVLVKNPQAARAQLEKAWREFFGVPLTPVAAKGLLMHYEKLYGRRATRKARRGSSKGKGSSKGNQRGGMAPINYIMGQGNTDYTYGRFPTPMSDPQVVRGLDLGRFYENRGSRACNTTGGFDAFRKESGIGAAQRGGASDPPGQKGAGLFDSISAGYVPASVPRNLLETVSSSFSSRPISDGNPSPIKDHVALAVSDPRAFDAKFSSLGELRPIHRM
jgi:hypothetical protein